MPLSRQAQYGFLMLVTEMGPLFYCAMWLLTLVHCDQLRSPWAIIPQTGSDIVLHQV